MGVVPVADDHAIAHAAPAQRKAHVRAAVVQGEGRISVPEEHNRAVRLDDRHLPRLKFGQRQRRTQPPSWDTWATPSQSMAAGPPTAQAGARVAKIRSGNSERRSMRGMSVSRQTPCRS